MRNKQEGRIEMAQEGEGTNGDAIIVEPGGDAGVVPPPPDSYGTNLGLLILSVVLLVGIMASNVWLRKRAERDDS
jgi:hypothetical protein